MQVTLTFVKNENKTSKAGKSYSVCSIKTKEHGDVFINGFGNKTTESWKIGDIVEAEIFDEEYNGKTSKKFKALSGMDILVAEVNNLKDRVEVLELVVQKLQSPSEEDDEINFA